MAVSALVSGQLFARNGLNLSDDDPEIVEKAIEGMLLFVDAAAELECGVVAGWVRGKVGKRDKNLVLAKQAAAIRKIGD
ncbi:MAG: sugar phosphate isomerase/epimerase [Planctomycetota bacterium]|jgi:hypothetical protein|nr:sugar phosphate isomerase/epimerase [Planctomycetota bacterium]